MNGKIFIRHTNHFTSCFTKSLTSLYIFTSLRAIIIYLIFPFLHSIHLSISFFRVLFLQLRIAFFVLNYFCDKLDYARIDANMFSVYFSISIFERLYWSLKVYIQFVSFVYVVWKQSCLTVLNMAPTIFNIHAGCNFPVALTLMIWPPHRIDLNNIQKIRIRLSRTSSILSSGLSSIHFSLCFR